MTKPTWTEAEARSYLTRMLRINPLYDPAGALALRRKLLGLPEAAGQGQAVARRAPPQERAALIAEVDRLRREFWTLNSEIASLRARVNAVDGSLTSQLKEVIRLNNRVLEAEDWKRESGMSVWLPHLLAVTQAAVDPGKQMLVESISVNASQGTIDVRVLATSWDVALSFVKQINETRVDGKTPYRASAAAWQESKSAAEPKFRGKVDVKVELLNLRKFQGESKQREKERKKLLEV